MAPTSRERCGIGIALLFAACLCSACQSQDSSPAAPAGDNVVVSRNCVECHGGEDGELPALFNAPKVTRYWKSSGHGKATNPPVTCEDCHDVGLSAETHQADGSGLLNTEDWPGKPGGSTIGANTAHLKPFLLRGATAAEIAANLDRGCENGPGDGTACHVQRGIALMRHTLADNLLVQFGRHGTFADPKSRTWYAPLDYEADFYKSWSPWVGQDLTTAAVGPIYYAPCVACHDPHGTGTTDVTTVGDNVSNRMIRGNWKSTVDFCNGCHR